MEKRALGKTGMELSLIGFGGFHLVELSSEEAGRLLNMYLDMGGNYIESAAMYGNGHSEKKVGKALTHRRDEFFLATKTMDRTKKEAEASINRSLKNLQTDYVDIIFLHEVQTPAHLEAVMAEDGALQALIEAQKAGKTRFIGVTGHGRMKTMAEAIDRYPFDVCMTSFNYFDRFNFPYNEEVLLSKALDKGIGMLGMKALADGLLYKTPELGIRYNLGLPITSLLLGMNTEEFLKKDMEIAENFTPLTDKEKENLFRESPELGDYVCRLCGKCKQNGFDPQQYFLLEGLYDRQMNDRRSVADTPHYIMREFLRFWFDQHEEAKQEYAALTEKVDPNKDYSPLNKLCPYGIDIDRKLKITHDKLVGAAEYVY